VAVAVALGEGVGVELVVAVAVAVALGEGVGVELVVAVAVAVALGDGVGVELVVAVAVAVAVAVVVGVGVGPATTVTELFVQTTPLYVHARSGGGPKPVSILVSDKLRSVTPVLVVALHLRWIRAPPDVFIPQPPCPNG
jgi:hypothetical protein